MTRQPCPVPAARTLERDDIRILPAYLTRRRGRTGAAGYDPRMLLALRIYAYRHQVQSSKPRGE